MTLFLKNGQGIKKTSEKVTFNANKLKRYFPADFTTVQMEEVILRLLEEWNRKGE